MRVSSISGPACISKGLQWNWCEVIVDETIKCREQSHQKKHILDLSEHSHRGVRIWFRETKVSSKDEENRSMHDITKHHTKQEGESYSSKDCWVYLLVLWDAVSVHNLLERPWELVDFNQCGSYEKLLVKLLNQVNIGAIYLWLLLYLKDFVLKSSSVLRRGPK